MMYLLFVCNVSPLNKFVYDSLLKSYKEKLWLAKGNHKVLIFGSNSSEVMTHGRYNSNNNIKYVFKIHVGDEFDVRF